MNFKGVFFNGFFGVLVYYLSESALGVFLVPKPPFRQLKTYQSNSYDTGTNEVSISVQAVFNQGGVLGQVQFFQANRDAPVIIQTNLLGLDQFSDNYRWSVHDFPIRSSLLRNFPCSDAQVGGIYNPSNAIIPGNCSARPCAVGDFTSKYGSLNMENQVFTDPTLDLFGPQSIIGRSLVIDRQDGPPGAFICANVEQKAVRRGELSTLRASFDNGIIQGDVIIRLAEGKDEVTIEADLFRVDGGLASQDHSWSLNFGRANSTCGGLGEVFGSVAYDPADFSCSMDRQRECAIGDLTSKCGPLNFDANGRAHVFCTDSQLGTINPSLLLDQYNFDQRLTVRIGESGGSGNDLGCASLEVAAPRTVTASFTMPFGSFQFWQNGPDDRTFVRAAVSLDRNGSPFSLRIFEGRGPASDPCNATLLGNIYTRPERAFTLPIKMGGIITSDSCVLGGLNSILPLDGVSSLRSDASTSFLPLFGPYSIIGRTLALVRADDTIAACSLIVCPDCKQGENNSLLGYQDLNNPRLR